MRNLKSAAVAALSFGALATAAHATVIAQQDFDGTAGDNLTFSSIFAQTSAGGTDSSTTTIAPDSTTGSGNSLQVTTNYSNGYEEVFAKLPETVTLTNVGNYIELSLNYRNVSGFSGSGFLPLLLNDQGTPTAPLDDAGYGFSLGNPTSGNNGSSHTIVETGGADSITNSDGGTGLDTPSSGATATHGSEAITITITKESNGYQIASTYSPATNGTSDTITDATYNYSSFDAIAFDALTGESYAMDNIVVSTNVVPEPASLSLLGLASLGLLSRRRTR